jgi:hypothetical protein
LVVSFVWNTDMKSFIKIALFLIATSVVAYTQTTDSSKASDSTAQNIQSPNTVVYPAGEKKAVTKIIPKTPTNWSKVKELFL